jgi:hypothetical protein
MNADTPDDLIPDEWKWKRLRNIAFSIEFWPLQWHLGVWRDDDFYGGTAGIGLGPIWLALHYNSMDGALARLIGPHCEMDVRP